MAIGWAQAEALSNKILEIGGIYLRLVNDGDKVVVAFRGEPYARQVHWTGAAYEECEGKDCPHCAAGIRSSLRVACNVYVVAERAMKIIEGGPRWFGDLLKVRNKYGLDSWAFEIQRNGAANSPKTTYTILPDKQLSAADLAQIGQVKLHDLARDTRPAAEAVYAEDRQQQAVAPHADRGEAVRVEVARAMHERLRTLPKQDVAAFFETFGVTRVSELRAADEAQAKDWLVSREDTPF